MKTNLTAEMRRALDIATNDGVVFSGAYITEGCRKKDISGSTLQALAARGLVTLHIGPDGTMMARFLATRGEKEGT